MLNEVIRVDLTGKGIEKVTFEQILQGAEGVSQAGFVEEEYSRQRKLLESLAGTCVLSFFQEIGRPVWRQEVSEGEQQCGMKLEKSQTPD